jgi:hypothetical protein
MEHLLPPDSYHCRIKTRTLLQKKKTEEKAGNHESGGRHREGALSWFDLQDAEAYPAGAHGAMHPGRAARIYVTSPYSGTGKRKEEPEEPETRTGAGNAVMGNEGRRGSE